jgi:glutamate dehydrogenase/leucine dehydrogenase
MLDPTKFPEYDHHHEVIEVHNQAVGLRGFIAIHRVHDQYPSLGATRWWEYGSEEDALRDALRLSRLMTDKSRAVGLPYGGAKAVLLRTPHALQQRRELLRTYAEELNVLQGKFITGSDMGIQDDDLQEMSKVTPYVIGEGVPAAYWTARGVIYALQYCLGKLFGTKTVLGHSFAIQGLGKTGLELVELLYNNGLTRLIVTDTDAKLAEVIRRKFPLVTWVTPEAIYDQVVDIFCPCGSGGVLNLETVFRLRSKAVIGTANNQLVSPEIMQVLSQRGIMYAPDFIVNAGGLLSVVDHYTHERTYQAERVEKALWRIPTALHSFFESHYSH